MFPKFFLILRGLTLTCQLQSCNVILFLKVDTFLCKEKKSRNRAATSISECTSVWGSKHVTLYESNMNVSSVSDIDK